MQDKIARINALFGQTDLGEANAIGVALMVCAVKKIRLELDVNGLSGGIMNTNVCFNHQVCFLRLQNNKIKENSEQWSHTSVVEGLKVSDFFFCWTLYLRLKKKLKPKKIGN